MEFEFLDPAAVRLFRGPSGAARLEIEGHDRSYLRVRISRAFPMSEPNAYIGFLDGDGKDIGMVRDTDQLDEQSRKIIEEELGQRYFLPAIRRISRLNHEFDLTYFEVETDRGRRDFTVRGHSENVVEISPGRFIIEDVDGNRFEIPNLYLLDRQSQDFMARII